MPRIRLPVHELPLEVRDPICETGGLTAGETAGETEVEMADSVQPYRRTLMQRATGLLCGVAILVIVMSLFSGWHGAQSDAGRSIMLASNDSAGQVAERHVSTSATEDFPSSSISSSALLSTRSTTRATAAQASSASRKHSETVVACSQVGENCSASGCCADASHRCFVKNEYWAGCLKSCRAGKTLANDPYPSPWNCALVKSTQATLPSKGTIAVAMLMKPSGGSGCAKSGEDCTKSACCADAGHVCFRKNQDWSGCLKSCGKGMVLAGDDQPTAWDCSPVLLTVPEDLSPWKGSSDVPHPGDDHRKDSRSSGGKHRTTEHPKATGRNRGEAEVDRRDEIARVAAWLAYFSQDLAQGRVDHGEKVTKNGNKTFSERVRADFGENVTKHGNKTHSEQGRVDHGENGTKHDNKTHSERERADHGEKVTKNGNKTFSERVRADFGEKVTKHGNKTHSEQGRVDHGENRTKHGNKTHSERGRVDHDEKVTNQEEQAEELKKQLATLEKLDPHGEAQATMKDDRMICASRGENCLKSMCCASKDDVCYHKDAKYGECLRKCDPNIGDTKAWSCKRQENQFRDRLLQ
jgi:hypothetical protein